MADGIFRPPPQAAQRQSKIAPLVGGPNSWVATTAEAPSTADVATRLAALHRTAGGSYRSTVLADSPVAYWRLGETSGTTAADQMGSYPLAYDQNFGGSPDASHFTTTGLIAGPDTAAG